ncbi:putative bifunctional diguanylate cyclase/phosphodiesterase [Zhongshania sp. BJYM1]|uniref:putative bifunctional diguanylate cyclase/phosphodiesterase n=1 Tax=Zhongshania aquatica TaxID=2965069 RepID=UPI0022B47813|nr:GGDEF domain-containing phosphodiesterase [Marortus sp. BJYM1]
MAGRGYYTYTQTTALYRETVREDLLDLEASFKSISNNANSELFNLTNSQNLHYLISPEQRQNPESNKPSIFEGKTGLPEKPATSFSSSIESAYYLNYNGEEVTSSGIGTTEHKITSEQKQSIIKAVQNRNRAVATIVCEEKCYQRLLIPTQDINAQKVILVIHRSAELLLNDFSGISGANIAIIKLPEVSKKLTAEHILLASPAATTPKILQKISDKIDVHDYINNSFFDSTNFYSTRFLALSSDESNNHYIAIVKDHAKVYRQIFRATNELLLTSFITLIIILILIAIILKPPLNRLSELTKILPLLPLGRFDNARQLLKKLESNSHWIDEIDILANTVDKVIDSLDSMDRIVIEHKNELAVKIDALTEAKIFNETLLDTSPLAIIIHDADGKIRNINKLGRELTGLTEQVPQSANINSWLRNERQTKNLSTQLLPILSSDGTKIQSETTFFTADGRKLDFLWTHSSLCVGGDRKILSLGIDITERREADESLSWLGQHDRVTGLLNRSSFTEDANNYIDIHHNSMLIELLMLDIDDFAAFNDRHGFDAGDKLLNDLAAHLHKSLPLDTILSRTGSGEFCALICHKNNSQKCAKDLDLDHLTRFAFKYDGDEEEVCLSGVIDAYDESLTGIDELISNTTSTMIRVKNKLRGHLYYAAGEHDDGKRSSRHKKYQMKEQLLSALNENRLVLFYQPILDLRSNRISHCECLVRLLDEEGQFIAPAKFLGIASESGLLPKLDYSVIEKAMRQQSLWEESGITTGLSINVTAPTLEQADFKQRIESLIHLTGANPKRLIFEIVETDAISNLNIAHDLLNHFKSIGAKIAFDDFGIGFTSFEYVRDLPVDFIKIDQSFIRFINEREQDRVLVKSMIDMSHSLGKKVIVEGVENRIALNIVKDMGVEYVQGYHVCRPMPISALDLSLHLRQ